MERIIVDNAISYLFKCPHCHIPTVVQRNEVNCAIFRCGVFKATNIQIPQHAPKHECDRFARENLIHGCGKPYIISLSSFTVLPCDYSDDWSPPSQLRLHAWGRQKQSKRPT